MVRRDADGCARRRWHDVSLALIALAVSAAICWWLARYISAPVTKLQVIARTLASGNLDTRMDEPFCRRRDEIGILAQDFNQMAARLQAQMASKEMLIRDISHELRSPLTRLRVALGLAQRDGDDATSASNWNASSGTSSVSMR